MFYNVENGINDSAVGTTHQRRSRAEPCTGSWPRYFAARSAARRLPRRLRLRARGMGDGWRISLCPPRIGDSSGRGARSSRPAYVSADADKRYRCKDREAARKGIWTFVANMRMNARPSGPLWRCPRMSPSCSATPAPNGDLVTVTAELADALGLLGDLRQLGEDLIEQQVEVLAAALALERIDARYELVLEALPGR
jgi:hypothetical protein